MNTVPFPSERAIEDYLWESLRKKAYCILTDNYVDYSYRQLAIPGYGITDLVHVSIDHGLVTVTVIELKNESLKEAHLSQLARYMTGLNRYIQRFERIASRYDWSVEVNGVLAVTGSVGEDFPYLLNQLSNIAVVETSLSIESGFKQRHVFSREKSRKGEDFSGLDEIGQLAFDLAKSSEDNFRYWKSGASNRTAEAV